MCFTSVMVFHQNELWELNHKANFDPLKKLITIHPDVSTIDVRSDLYSDFKEWVALADNRKWKPAIRVVGGDLLPSGDTLGATFFLTNGWRIYLDHAVSFVGNLYTDDYSSAYVLASGVQLASEQVSTLTELNTVNVPTTTETASAVRTELAIELAYLDAALSSRASQTAMDTLQAAMDAAPTDMWAYLMSNTFPAGSAGEKLKQALTLSSFLALK